MKRKYYVCKESVNINGDRKVIPIISKTDLLNERDLKNRINEILELTNTVPCGVSGKDGTGADELIIKLKSMLRFPIEVKITLNNANKTQNALSRFYEIADVKTVEYSNKGHSVTVHMLCESKDMDIIKFRYGNLIKKIRIIK